jgi:hypothetical protein
MLNTVAGNQTVAATAATPRGTQGNASGVHDARRTVLPDVPLHERTFKWLATLPAEVRPMATARQYPRIANRIGELWGNCEYSRLYLQGLLRDRRNGRRGFPAMIRKELETLQTYYFENLSGLPAVLWNAVPLHEPRIPHKTAATATNNAEIELLPL